AGIDAGATVRLSVEQIKGLCRQRIEVTNCRADRGSAAGGIRERLSDEMIVRAPSDGDDVARAARGLNRALTRTAVTSRYSHHESRFDSVVETMGQQVIVTMVTSTQGQIENIHAVLNCRINGV